MMTPAGDTISNPLREPTSSTPHIQPMLPAHTPTPLCSGDGSRLPTDDEKEFARAYGGKLAGVVKAYVTGKAATA